MQPPTDHERPHTALVTGGTGGLGTAVVDLLLERGEHVCVPWRSKERAEQLRSRHPDAIDDGRLRLSECNAADAEEMAALLDVLEADWGPLWLCCALAGAWGGGEDVEHTDDLATLDRMVTANLRTAFVTAREGLRHMGPDGGRLVFVGSATVDRPAAGQAAYTAANAGVHSLVRTLAAELAGSGRTANAVVPTVIDTPANREAMPDADHDRWTDPRAIAKVIAWLGSAEAGTCNGALVPVPGAR